MEGERRKEREEVRYRFPITYFPLDFIFLSFCYLPAATAQADTQRMELWEILHVQTVVLGVVEGRALWKNIARKYKASRQEAV